MRVLVLGGTGFVGRSLVPMLLRNGDEVRVGTRRAENVPRALPAGAYPVVIDLTDAAASTPERVGPTDAIVLLAAPRLFGKRLGAARFRALKAELTAIHSNALSLASRLACPIIITGGTAFATRRDEVADETWPIARTGATRVGEEIDVLVARALDAGTPKLVWMLPGQIYGPGGMFLKQYEWALHGINRFLGDGANRIPRIHVDDCAAAYALALARIGGLPNGQRFIVADDVACTAHEFQDELARLLGLPPAKPAPALVVRLLLGKLLFATATLDCRVTNALVKRELGWAPRYPSYREGLRATIEALRRTRAAS